MNIDNTKTWVFISAFIFFISNTGFCQELADPPVIAKFRSYSARAFQEKLFLHTDKDFYAAGEILWFKIYAVDGTFHRPSELSKIAYIEILNERNEPVLQNMVSLVPGKNNGSFYLPTSLNTGYYTIRAYTSWMKNFGAATFARKPVYIVNPAKPGLMNTSNTAQEEQTAAGNAVRIETSKKQYGKREPVTINFSTGKPSRVSVSVYRTDNLEKGSDNIYMSHVADPCSVRKSL